MKHEVHEFLQGGDTNGDKIRNKVHESPQGMAGL